MPQLVSRLDPATPQFAASRARMLALLDEVNTLQRRVREHSARAAAKFRARGALLPHERVGLLLDRGSPFVELSTLAGLGMHDDDGAESPTGGCLISGVGFVSGVRCVVLASDSGIKGGAMTPMALEKTLRAQEIALQNKLPLVSLIESAGANLLHQAELFVRGGRVFKNLARLSAAGIPLITVVHGSSTAGGAYIPGMSDHVVLVRGQSKVFLAGPPLVRAATGEVATDEELGGAELHATVTGTGEHLAEDDVHALALTRELVGKLGWRSPAAPPGGKPPRYAEEELLGLVPVDAKTAYDVRELLARLVDDSDFLEHKALYGPGTVCGYAALEGQPCGFLGNNGPIDPAGATKAAHFIQACCQVGLPLVYLQNTTGYLVGKDAESAGMVKHGSKMIQAVANASVPQLTLVVGGSFGAGNYGMCGRAFDPRFIFSWPNARTAVMGGEQAARVMRILGEAKASRSGAVIDEEQLAAMEKVIVDQIDRESTALFGTARLWDDGILDPRDSRRVLAFGLATCREGDERALRPTSFGVARP